MDFEDFEDGDRVYVRWYGGSNMSCVVVDTPDGKRVQKETSYGKGTGKKMIVGDKDIVEEPKSWGTTVWHHLEEEKMNDRYK